MSDVDEPQTERELLLAVHRDVKELLKCKNDHETRIRNLEDARVYLLGAAAAITILIPVVWNQVRALFGGS